TPKPLINDIFGQSEVKDTFVATPVSTKENTKNTLDIKKSLANTGTTVATTGFFGLITLLTAFVLRRKVNK
ncbi:MAG: peptidase, partial [Gemella haemolysans]|nr:peptidase [Gemella haemolysans]